MVIKLMEGEFIMENTSVGKFCGSVLLSENMWDKQQLLNDLKEEWEIEISLEGTEEDNDNVIGDVNGYRIVISKFPMPVPNREAEVNAENNYMWQEAVEVTSTHKAHILIAVLGDGTDLIDRGLIYTKIMSICTKQKYAIGVFTSGVVFEPNYYFDVAQSMKKDELPILNWIWFGLYTTENGISGYTYGMDVFGKYELEILDAKDDAEKIYEFLITLATYVIEEDVELKDGETIGFSKKDIHEIKLSKGVALPEQDTLKISYEVKKKHWWKR